VAMTAAFRALVGRTPPAARLEAHHCQALRRRVDCWRGWRGRAVRATRGGWAGEWLRHPISSILDERPPIFPAVSALVALPGRRELTRQSLSADLRAHEDERGTVRAAQVRREPLEFRGRRHYLGSMRDRFWRSTSPADLNECGVAHDFERKPHHIIRHRRREQ